MRECAATGRDGRAGLPPATPRRSFQDRSAEVWPGFDAYGDYLYANTSVSCPRPSVCTVVLDASTGTDVLRVEGVPRTVLPPARPGDTPQLMTWLETDRAFTTRYDFVTLPRLPGR